MTDLATLGPQQLTTPADTSPQSVSSGFVSPVRGSRLWFIAVLTIVHQSMCSPAGGQAAAQQVVADEQGLGVIGTSCSGAGAVASEVLSAAGLVARVYAVSEVHL